MNSAYYAEMTHFIEYIKRRFWAVLGRVGYREGQGVKFTLALTFATFFAFLASKYGDSLSFVAIIFFSLVWGVITLAMFAMAGRSVFKALSVVGAGVSLSVIVFLSSAYCALDANKQVADDALKILVIFGLTYATLQFLTALWREVFGGKTDERGGVIKSLYEKEEHVASLIAIGIYLAGVGAFIGLLIQVAYPILTNECYFI